MRALALGLTVAIATAAGSDATIVEKVSRGPVTATLSYVQHADYPPFTNVRLRISLGGRTVVDTGPPHCRGCPAWPAIVRHSLSVEDLDGDARPEVVVYTYTGGVHCCWVFHVYRQIGASFVPRSYDSGNAGIEKRDLDRDGIPELVTADWRFDYLFTSHAGSLEPLRILDYRHGAFVVVTGRFRSEIRKAERDAWKTYLRERRRNDVRGIVGGWAADKYLLREGADVWPVVTRAAAAGDLNGEGSPSGEAYVRFLRRKLGELGYLRLR